MPPTARLVMDSLAPSKRAKRRKNAIAEVYRTGHPQQK
jgi:hypothetical protein